MLRVCALVLLPVCLSLFEGQVQGLGAHPACFPSGTNQQREKRQVQPRQNKIKYIFVEHYSNWSRNNLIAPSKICLDFQGPWNYGGEQRDEGGCGGEEKRTRMFSLVCGWTWWSTSEQKEKKRRGNRKAALISRVIIKRRDPLKRPISN